MGAKHVCSVSWHSTQSSFLQLPAPGPAELSKQHPRSSPTSSSRCAGPRHPFQPRYGSSKGPVPVPQSQGQPKLCGSTLQVLSLTMGAPRWPTRAGLGGSWFSSMMQGEVIPRGARYSAIITALYASSRNTLRPAGTDRRWSEVHREHSGGC